MATDDNGFFVPDAGSSVTPSPSPVERFDQETKSTAIPLPTRAVQPTPTRVGKVEEAVGGALSTATNTPFIGTLINPALSVMGWMDDNIFEPLVEEATAPFLVNDVSKRNPQNTLIQNWRLAREYANDVNIGQAAAKPLTQLTLAMLGNTPLGKAADNIYASQPYMNEEFDIFNTEEREAYFKDDLMGIAISGGITLGAMMIGSKGIGVGWRAGRGAVFGERVIRSDADMVAFNNRLDTAASKVNAGVTTGPLSDGMTKFLADAVQESDVDRLLNNPLVAASNNPARSATILSRIDNANDVADFLKAERGDKSALNRLFKSQASAADALDNHGLKMKPLSDFAEVNALPDKAMASRLSSVLADISKKDPELSRALDNFAAEKANGIALSSYQPGRIAGIEALNTTRARLKAMGQYGDLKLLGEASDGWRVKVYQNSVYDRAVRFITWAGTGRPQGHVNVSTPRRYEAQYDILSEVNRLNFLKGAKGAELKRSIIRDYMEQPTDYLRAQSLERAENRILLAMADHYGIGKIEGIDNNYAAYKQLEEWHKGIAPRKQSVRQFLNDNDFVVDMDGNLNVVDLKLRATEPQSVPMLDFRRLELEVIRQMRRATTVGENPVGLGAAARAAMARTTMGVGTFLDIANMVFSNLNLLRLAYIPKNSIVDPYARAAMDTETLFGLDTAVQGIGNIAYNRSMAVASGALNAFTKYPRARLSKELKQLSDKFASDVRSQRLLEKEARNLDDALIQARTRLTKVKDPAKRASLEQKINGYQGRIKEIDTELSGLRARMPALESSISATRKSLFEKENKLAEIRSKRKYIGQEDFTIDVDGVPVTIKGLANRNVKGSKAYFSSISAMDDFYNATRRSEVSNKISASRAQFVPISRNNWPEYSNAMMHVANRHLRNELEEIGGMALRGESVDAMMNWLYKSRAGREYLNRMSDRLVDKSAAGVRSWLEQTRADVLAMFPDQRARDIILERDITKAEIDSLFRGRQDLPSKIKGPDIAAGIADKLRKESGQVNINPVTYAAAAIGDVSDLGWRFLSGFENRLVRNPLFMVYTREAMADQVRAAKRAGIDIANEETLDQIRQIAYRSATERIEQTLYSARRLTNSGYIARYLMAFPAAYFNSQIIALRLMAKNPANAMWYANIIDALDGFHPYMDEDGNVYKEYDEVPKGKNVTLQFPMYDYMGKIPVVGEALQGVYRGSMGLYTDEVGGGVKINPKQMEFMVGDPSISWMGSIALSEAIKRGVSVGPWKIYGEQIDQAIRQAVGDDVYESSVLFQGRPIAGENLLKTTYNAMIPTYLKSAQSGIGALVFNSDQGWFVSDDAFARDLAANTKLAVRNAARDGGQVPTPIELIHATGFMSLVKSFFQFNSPLATTFDPATRAAMERFDELVTIHGGDTDKASEAFADEFGFENLALLGSSNKNTGGLASTKKDLRIYRKHADLMYQMYMDTGRNPSAAGMLSFGYGDVDDAYDEVTAAIFKTNSFPGLTDPMLDRKSFDEVLKDPERRLGWYEYTKLVEFRDSVLEQYGIESTRDEAYTKSGLRAWFITQEDILKNKYKSWAAERDEQRNGFWTNTFPALLAATDNQAWMRDAATQGVKWSEIADWTEKTRIWHDALIAAQGGALGDSVSQQDLKNAYAIWHYQFVKEASPEFQVFSARWLSFPELEPEDDAIRALVEASGG